MESQKIEFKESWHDEYLEWICAFANTDGGTLFIGKDDRGNVKHLSNAKKLLEDIPNKIVQKLDIACSVNLLTENEKNYLEIVVPKVNFPVSCKGRFYYRSGSTKQELKGAELHRFLMKKLNSPYDEQPRENATLRDIDKSAVEYFQRISIMNGRMPETAFSKNVENVLKNLNLYTNDGILKNSAILAFGKNPKKFFTSCDFRIGRFGDSDNDLLFQDVVEGDLIRMADKVMDLLKSKYLISPIHYEGLVRIEKLEIPEDALREAIFNSIIHKDYTGVHIQMKVYNDHIELWNPGALPEGYTIKDILKGHASIPRNSNLANIFYKAGFIENWGRGISKITEGFKASGLEAPQFEIMGDGVKIVLKRPKGDEFSVGTKDMTQGVSQGVTQGVTQGADSKIVEFCKTPRTLQEIADHLGVKDKYYMKKHHLNKLLGSTLKMTDPDSPNSPTQKYYSLQEDSPSSSTL